MKKKKKKIITKVENITTHQSKIDEQANSTKSIGFGIEVTKSCHKDPTEIYPSFFVGSRWSVKAMVKQGVTLLVPLASLGGDIWKTGFRGRILYYPIEDFGALPLDVLDRAVKDIIQALEGGERVGIFCLGGHGRTGYMASAVLGKLMPDKDSIAYLREVYCQKAVESREQIESLAQFLQREDIKNHSPATFSYSWGYSSSSAGSGSSTACGTCTFWDDKRGRCDLYDTTAKVVTCPDYYPLYKVGNNASYPYWYDWD